MSSDGVIAVAILCLFGVIILVIDYIAKKKEKKLRH